MSTVISPMLASRTLCAKRLRRPWAATQQQPFPCGGHLQASHTKYPLVLGFSHLYRCYQTVIIMLLYCCYTVIKLLVYGCCTVLHTYTGDLTLPPFCLVPGFRRDGACKSAGVCPAPYLANSCRCKRLGNGLYSGLCSCVQKVQLFL